MTTLTLLSLTLFALITAAAIFPRHAVARDRAKANVPAHKQSWQQKWRVWMPPVWQRLARCESGQWPPNWKHDSGTYTGAFGFYIGSWLDYRYPGYPARASAATPWQQYRVALRIHSRFGFTGWGCYDHPWVRG